MKETRARKRKMFLRKMSEETIASYEDIYKDWYDDEREFLPIFLSQVGRGKRIIDFAGGCGKAVPQLLRDDNSVVLGDLSLGSLMEARRTLVDGDIHIVRFDMLAEPPFADGSFDGIWFAEAFEYVPPDAQEDFLRALRRIMKKGGILFMSAEGLSAELTRFKYLRNYLYWKIVRRAPVIWGEYIYRLELPAYRGWHYHSLVLSRRFERKFSAAGFEVLKRKDSGQTEYASYILRAV